MRSRKTQIADQWIEVHMPKGAEAVSGFRSWPAFLYACLAEGDAEVVSFTSTNLVALPYYEAGRKKVLRPDLLVTASQRHVVVVIGGNKEGALPPAADEALNAWCNEHACAPAPVLSTAIEARWMEAINWFRITRWLAHATSSREKERDYLAHALRTLDGPTIYAMSRHLSTLPREAVHALVADLLHNHVARADLASAPIAWDTRLFPA